MTKTLRLALLTVMSAALLLTGGSALATPPTDSQTWTSLGASSQACLDAGGTTFTLALYTLGERPEVFAGKPPTPPQPPSEPPFVRKIDRIDASNGCQVPMTLTFQLQGGTIISGAILPGVDRTVGLQELDALGIRLKVSDLAGIGTGGEAEPPFDFVIAP